MSPARQIGSKGGRKNGKSAVRFGRGDVASSPSFKFVLVCIALILLTAVIYSPVSGYPFTNYDDPDCVTQNAHVQAGLNWQTVRWARTAMDASNWHPVTWLSHAAAEAKAAYQTGLRLDPSSTRVQT